TLITTVARRIRAPQMATAEDKTARWDAAHSEALVQALSIFHQQSSSTPLPNATAASQLAAIINRPFLAPEDREEEHEPGLVAAIEAFEQSCSHRPAHIDSLIALLMESSRSVQDHVTCGCLEPEGGERAVINHLQDGIYTADNWAEGCLEMPDGNKYLALMAVAARAAAMGWLAEQYSDTSVVEPLIGEMPEDFEGRAAAEVVAGMHLLAAPAVVREVVGEEIWQELEAAIDSVKLKDKRSEAVFK
ncbi:hypothetical protein HDU96_002667, partial [Phlyctochytrium bullatum]